MEPLLSAALQLMFVGMGTVFFFLTLLVLAMLLMSRLLHHITPVAEPAEGIIPREHVAAISAAIAKYRQDGQLVKPGGSV